MASQNTSTNSVQYNMIFMELVFSPPLVIARPKSNEDLESDMLVKDLDEEQKFFWMVGAKGNVSALHHQKVILRTIILTERPKLHLVWSGRTIYVKPLPDYLLDHDYVRDNVLTNEELKCTVIGFLRTYCKLIQSTTDLKIAHELGLLNESVDWAKWDQYRSSIEASTTEKETSPRYEFGELRLNRLDLIWRLRGRGLTYFTVHREYATYFQQYFSLFIAAFAIVATILTAMQVLVGIETTPATVVDVSYWFGIVALIAILSCLTPVLLLATGLVVWNVRMAMSGIFC